jgi:hypothetical protein
MIFPKRAFIAKVIPAKCVPIKDRSQYKNMKAPHPSRDFHGLPLHTVRTVSTDNPFVDLLPAPFYQFIPHLRVTYSWDSSRHMPLRMDTEISGNVVGTLASTRNRPGEIKLVRPDLRVAELLGRMRLNTDSGGGYDSIVLF